MNLPPTKLPPADSAEILQLNVRFKKQAPEPRTLTVQKVGQCFHQGGFILDETLEHVLCKQCNEKLNPMYVLKRLANQETKFHEAAQRYQDEMQRLNERSRTKCQHCHQMTPISR